MKGLIIIALLFIMPAQAQHVLPCQNPDTGGWVAFQLQTSACALPLDYGDLVVGYFYEN